MRHLVRTVIVLAALVAVLSSGAGGAGAAESAEPPAAERGALEYAAIGIGIVVVAGTAYVASRRKG